MDITLDIIWIVLPIVIVGGIGLFIVKGLRYKSYDRNDGKRKSRNAEHLLNSIIPFGLIIGCVIGVTLSMFLQISLLHTISLGSAIGLLLGYLVYDIFCTNLN